MSSAAEALADTPRTGHTSVPGLVWAFRVHPDGTADELPADRPIEDHHDGWLWLHLNLADTRACQWLRSKTDLPAESIRLLLSTGTHSELHAIDDCTYGAFGDMVRALDRATDEIGFLRFAMTQRLMISGRHHALHAIENTRRALREGLRVPSVAALLEAIVSQVADAIDQVIGEIGEELDRIEECVLQDDVREQRRLLGSLRRRGVRMHRQLAGLRSLFHRLERDMADASTNVLRIGGARLAQRLDGLDHEVVAMRERAHLLQEEIGQRLGEQSAGSLHILSVITTLLLPPTLVAGIFGMNTKGLPFTENDTGFWWSMALLVLSGVAACWLLKRIGILR